MSGQPRMKKRRPKRMKGAWSLPVPPCLPGDEIPPDSDDNWPACVGRLCGNSLLVDDPISMNALYNYGCFGKGSLSRSCPGFAEEEVTRHQRQCHVLTLEDRRSEAERLARKAYVRQQLDRRWNESKGWDVTFVSAPPADLDDLVRLIDPGLLRLESERDEQRDQTSSPVLSLASPDETKEKVQVDLSQFEYQLDDDWDVPVAPASLDTLDCGSEGKKEDRSSMLVTDEAMVTESATNAVDLSHSNSPERYTGNQVNREEYPGENPEAESFPVEHIAQFKNNTTGEQVSVGVVADPAAAACVLPTGETTSSSLVLQSSDGDDIQHNSATPSQECTNSEQAANDAEVPMDADNFSESSISKSRSLFTENLVLTMEEAFFLSYSLSCLQVKNSLGNFLSLEEQWCLYCQTVPDFVSRYVVYHHFRSKGWVCKCGLKFGADFLLYRIGPEHFHSEYSVVLFPVTLQDKRAGQSKLVSMGSQNWPLSWHEVLRLGRVGEAVAKTIIVCFVLRPDVAPIDDSLCLPHLEQFSVQVCICQRELLLLFRQS